MVDLDGYEGPIDVLLTLAREQKVDLTKISILALADQYLAFIAAARQLRLEIAADYLVMAAWLAYLKSRLLLPEPPEAEEPTAKNCGAAGPSAAAAGGDARGGRAADGAAAARPRRVRARRAGGPAAQADPGYERRLLELLRAYGDQRQRKESARAAHRAGRTLFDGRRARAAAARARPHAGMAQPGELPAGGSGARAGRALGDRRDLRRQPRTGAAGKLELRQDRAFGPIFPAQHARRRYERQREWTACRKPKPTRRIARNICA